MARAIANSPLVKTALFGRDPNWGRIAQAAGMALVGARAARARRSTRSTRAEFASDSAEVEMTLRLGRGDGLRPRLVLGPQLRVRADQRGVHDLKRTEER